MTSGLPDGDLSEPVDRARQLHFLFPVEIGEIEKPELSVREERADHELVLWTFGRLVLGRRAERIGSAAGERLRHQLTVRCDDVDLNALHAESCRRP